MQIAEDNNDDGLSSINFESRIGSENGKGGHRAFFGPRGDVGSIRKMCQTKPNEPAFRSMLIVILCFLSLIAGTHLHADQLAGLVTRPTGIPFLCQWQAGQVGVRLLVALDGTICFGSLCAGSAQRNERSRRSIPILAFLPSVRCSRVAAA